MVRSSMLLVMSWVLCLALSGCFWDSHPSVHVNEDGRGKKFSGEGVEAINQKGFHGHQPDGPVYTTEPIAD